MLSLVLLPEEKKTEELIKWEATGSCNSTKFFPAVSQEKDEKK